ncbi:protein of unknown function [Candidatus Promineifilum breve]|uniref:Uncharacterized protein n=1 Tax=Candidatus Promineifilum breve TaxID=1806508 RepID=A0A160T1C5_9CHLR|nr:hypothetical protein [Candidatus Promineifilum breve]CUS03646.2 protein of unknown function [Candidatus Promineifilum breve]
MTDSESTARRHKQLIREMIAGYAVANEIIRVEKSEWLQSMTPGDSWDTFEELVAFGRRLQSDPTALKVFEPRRIEEHVHMRRVFEKLAITQGLL